MADPLFISDLISQIVKGQIRIPSFQRGFVWDAERVAHLMDSIYKGYPFGTLLFWKTKTALQTERQLGPFQLPYSDPEYPTLYVLDGQQRATSVFGVFQTKLEPTPGQDDSWAKIYFDLRANTSAQDSQFLHVPDDQVDPDRHFPLKILFDPPKYRDFLKTMDDSIADQVSGLYTRFTQAKIPVQFFSTDNRADVAIVFERINRLGVPLDTLQLLSAWSWSEDFDLQESFQDISDDLVPHGFADVGRDTDLLLRCCAAIISSDASPKTIINLKGTEVRNRFREIRTGIFGAVDYLKQHLNVYSAGVLPYTQILIPLSVFFATDKDQSTHPTAYQHDVLVRWLWRVFFSRRYSKRYEQLNEDIVEIQKLKNNTETRLGEFPCEIDESFFTQSDFKLGNVNTKTFVLMLASEAPLDFINGGTIALGEVLRGCNKKEFHHVYPKAYLRHQPRIDDRSINALVNFCLLPRASNNAISDQRPSQYRSMMPEDQDQVARILSRALCPENIFHDDYTKFVEERAAILVDKAKRLMVVASR